MLLEHLHYGDRLILRELVLIDLTLITEASLVFLNRIAFMFRTTQQTQHLLAAEGRPIRWVPIRRRSGGFQGWSGGFYSGLR